VLPLDSGNCGANHTTYIDDTIAGVLARCDAAGPTTRVVLTMLSRASDPADSLVVISQRFCGEVIGATAPEGWTVTLKRYKEHRNLASEVTWESAASATTGRATARRITDFAVTLRGAWSTGVGHSVLFSSGGPISMSPHDCPYSDR
jgi:hypothetical protein